MADRLRSQKTNKTHTLNCKSELKEEEERILIKTRRNYTHDIQHREWSSSRQYANGLDLKRLSRLFYFSTYFQSISSMCDGRG